MRRVAYCECPCDGLYVREAMVVAAIWLAMLALPLLFVAHRLPESTEAHQPTSMLGGYRKLWTEVAAEWRRDRNLVYFLFASALFRDGLAAIFAFGAVLGVNVYGISQGDVLIFGVAASVIAAVGAVLGGFVDHRVGSKPVIVASLVAIVALGLTLMVLSGSVAFWICGLLLCMFIGPSQSSSRALLLHMAKRRQGRCRVQPLHDDRAGGGVRRAVAVLLIRRRIRCRAGRPGRNCWC